MTIIHTRQIQLTKMHVNILN